MYVLVQVEALVKEVAAHEDKVEGLKKEIRRQAREASQMEKKVSQFTQFSPKITLALTKVGAYPPKEPKQKPVIAQLQYTASAHGSTMYF